MGRADLSRKAERKEGSMLTMASLIWVYSFGLGLIGAVSVTSFNAFKKVFASKLMSTEAGETEVTRLGV
jgi:hypothetical protein